MNRTIDDAIALRLLYLMVQPIKETDAFKLGIVDEKGKQLKRVSELKTDEEKNAFSYLHRLVFRIKSNLLPNGLALFTSTAIALSLIREDNEVEDITKVKVLDSDVIRLKQLYEDSVAPVTGVSSVVLGTGLHGPTDEPFKSKLNDPRLFKRKVIKRKKI